ncbi:MAG: peptidase S41 [Bacteroidetes bacterium]|nr:peptidase S41 [Fibrella sp.]
MKRAALFLLLLVWVFPSARPLFSQSLTPAQAHEDLQFLKRKLDLLHPGMGYYTLKARMEFLYDSLYNNLTAPVDYLAFYRHLSPLVTALKDGHTNLNHRRNFIDKTTRFVPFYIRQADNKYFISHNASEDTELSRGTELLTINGRSVAAIHRELMTTDHAGSDGDNLTGRQQWSMVQFADYYAAQFGSVDSVSVQYRLRGDTLVRHTRLGCPTATAFKETLSKRYDEVNQSRPNLSVRVVDELSHTAVLRVSTFSGPKKYDPFQWVFKRRLKQAFRQIHQRGIENLIVDLQNNGGGAVVNSARLLQYWLPKPFRVMDKEQLNTAAKRELVSRWNPISALNFSLRYKANGKSGFLSRSARSRFRPNKTMAFRGNLYFLMNGASFSASTSVLAKTLDASLGTYVGEASGSAYWGDFAGHFKVVTLPNSRLQVRIPLKKLTHAVAADRANGFTVEPDFDVSRSYDDLLNNRDYLLAYTLVLIKQGITARRTTTARPLQASR